MRNFIVLNPGSRVRVLLAVIFDYRDRVARMLVRNSLRYWIVFQGRFRKEGTTVRETDWRNRLRWPVVRMQEQARQTRRHAPFVERASVVTPEEWLLGSTQR